MSAKLCPKWWIYWADNGRLLFPRIPLRLSERPHTRHLHYNVGLLFGHRHCCWPNIEQHLGSLLRDHRWFLKVYVLYWVFAQWHDICHRIGSVLYRIILEQDFIECSLVYSNIRKDSISIFLMYMESFSILLSSKEHARTFCYQSDGFKIASSFSCMTLGG